MEENRKSVSVFFTVFQLQMGIKRKIEDQIDPSKKKAKSNGTFPLKTFVKNFKDPESSFLGSSRDRSTARGVNLLSRLALSEVNEYVRHLSTKEEIHQLMHEVLRAFKSNFDEILLLIGEEKRKGSEVRKSSSRPLACDSVGVEHHSVPFSHDSVGTSVVEKRDESAGSVGEEIRLHFQFDLHDLSDALQSQHSK